MMERGYKPAGDSGRPPVQELLEGREEQVVDGAEVLAALVQAELEEDQLPLLHFPGPPHDQGGFLQRHRGQNLSRGGAGWLLLSLRPTDTAESAWEATAAPAQATTGQALLLSGPSRTWTGPSAAGPVPPTPLAGHCATEALC